VCVWCACFFQAGAEQKFLSIKQAYGTLSDTTSRREYDRLRNAASASSSSARSARGGGGGEF
jgi:DnaJ-class molecular chaperone